MYIQIKIHSCHQHFLLTWRPNPSEGSPNGCLLPKCRNRYARALYRSFLVEQLYEQAYKCVHYVPITHLQGMINKVNNKKHSFCVILPGAPEMDSTLWNGSDSRCWRSLSWEEKRAVLYKAGLASVVRQTDAVLAIIEEDIFCKRKKKESKTVTCPLGFCYTSLPIAKEWRKFKDLSFKRHFNIHVTFYLVVLLVCLFCKRIKNKNKVGLTWLLLTIL